jgi:phosphoribosylamine--glycine ligase
MGAFTPLPSMSPALVGEVMNRIVEPTLRELRRRSIDYRGVLYAGVMLTSTGPRLLEYNVRFGDPETQVVVPMLADSPSELLAATASGQLTHAPSFRSGAAVTVVVAAQGYPGAPRSGDVIEGLGDDGQLAQRIDGVTVYHAGSRRGPGGSFVTDGGRVLSITAVASSIAAARERAYEAVAQVKIDGMVVRGDIAAGVDGGRA